MDFKQHSPSSCNLLHQNTTKSFYKTTVYKSTYFKYPRFLLQDTFVQSGNICKILENHKMIFFLTQPMQHKGTTHETSKEGILLNTAAFSFSSAFCLLCTQERLWVNHQPCSSLQQFPAGCIEYSCGRIGSGLCSINSWFT